MLISRGSSKLVRLLSGVCLAAWVAFPALGQEEGAEPTMLATGDFVSPDAPGVHVMTFLVEFAPGAVVPRHHHGGTSQVLLLEGEIEVTKADGSKVEYYPGDKFDEPAGEVHSGVITSSEPARMIWTIVLPDGAELETADEG